MKIYTKTGDKGLTSLIGGTRVPKSSLRIDCYGTVDELNSYIGLLRDQDVNAPRRDLLKEIQDRLFTIGASLASDPEKSKMKIPDLHEADVTLLETEMDQMNTHLPELRVFILPGGHQSVSFAHVARCVCRRAERLVIELRETSFVADLVVMYLNRLSDYLFVLSRQMGYDLGAEEVAWQPRM
ncbi:cob(I)yrinic acid a,c-diamide adenosyltransferase [Microvirga sp. STR05]|uniref:Corrinoid adenosyltransferase n=1 Tax=Hymenobacter duratus TaxID=2771356 RepID=A0ABR8JH98_9BACT|nr:cob(I)yrinic acid a,c-diamide adenosyltransferase [Hymenobacter duratus]MBD2714775.1 cob(I)yrinic acid a,c-diamide adenosyltransferase [Hymenobacter duratus]MBR7949680.1 cob(I)yrinic acid a,c-diamide adenosyltransferase [Microvirga sp. STR05]